MLKELWERLQHLITHQWDLRNVREEGSVYEYRCRRCPATLGPYHATRIHRHGPGLLHV